MYCPCMGSCTSRTGERRREISAHSSTVIVPSGRSAMICTVGPETQDPHQPETKLGEHRLDQPGDLCRHAGLANEACVGRSPAHRPQSRQVQVFASREAQATAQNKKSGPLGPTLKVEMIMSAEIVGRNRAHCKREVKKLSQAGSPPAKAEIVAPAARIEGLLLVAGGRPIRGALAPVGRAGGHPREISMSENGQQNPSRIVAVVGGDAQLCPGPHDARQLADRRGGHEPTLVVARLRPGIGEQNEDAADASLRQPAQERAGVVGVEPDIGEPLLARWRSAP